MSDEVTTDRILTIPNVITLVRLLCLPVFLWLLFGHDNRAGAALLLGALGATDFLDGYLARHLHQTSNLGKILDPVADRLLFFVGITAILVDGSVPPFYGWSILVREVLVAGATLALAAAGARRIDVTWWGKAGTFCNMFAFPFFLASHSTVAIKGFFGFAAWGFAIPGFAFSWYAALLYIPLARRALREGREARAADARVGSSPT